jgi:predicted kinase
VGHTAQNLILLFEDSGSFKETLKNSVTSFEEAVRLLSKTVRGALAIFLICDGSGSSSSLYE